MEDILSSTDKTIEDMCHEAVLLYSKYAKSIGCTLTTENIKQIYDGIIYQPALFFFSILLFLFFLFFL
jgi:hypothetical protein